MSTFSIITPVLNQAETIGACIRSVAAQAEKVQHIVIDGGSTDGTVDIIRDYEHELAFWVSENDRGQSHAINKGLEHATGRWFNWLNADDQLTENALHNVLHVATPDTLVVIGQCRHINKKGDSIEVGGARIHDSLEATLGNYSMGQPSVFYRTETVKGLGGLNEHIHLCLDMELWFRFLLKHGQEQVTSTQKVLSEFLVHEHAKSSAQADEMTREKYGIYHALLSSMRVPRVLQQFLRNYPIPPSVNFQVPSLDQEELLAHFAWHLMLDAYEKREIEQCSAYFDIVRCAARLSASEHLEWKARIASAKLLKR